MTYNVLMGTLNPTHSLSHSLPLHRLFAALKSIMVWHSGTGLTRTSWYTGFSMKTRGCVNTLQGRSFHKYVHSTVSGSQQIQEKECVFLVSVFFRRTLRVRPGCPEVSQTRTLVIAGARLFTGPPNSVKAPKESKAVCVVTQYAAAPCKLIICSYLFARWRCSVLA